VGTEFATYWDSAVSCTAQRRQLAPEANDAAPAGTTTGDTTIMLVLSRKVGQKIVLGDQVTITINRISGGRVSLGITAPPGVRVVRSELGPLDSPAVGGATNPASDAGFSNPTAPGGATTSSPNPISQR